MSEIPTPSTRAAPPFCRNLSHAAVRVSPYGRELLGHSGLGPVFRWLRSGLFRQAALRSLSLACSQSRPLAPRWLAASPLLWASPTSGRSLSGLCIRPDRCPCGRSAGYPRFLGLSFGARCPQPPRTVTARARARARCFRAVYQTSPTWTGWSRSSLLTRPNRVRFRCSSHLRFPRLRHGRLPATPLVGYTSNEQFTWLARYIQQERPGLSWRTQVRQDMQEEKQGKEREWDA